MTTREKLRTVVALRRFSGSEMAEAAEVSTAQYYAWVSDRPQDSNRKPGYEQLFLMCRKLGVTMESMVDPEMAPEDLELPHDEAEVLRAYRHQREVEGLTHTAAIHRMNKEPVVAPRGSRITPP